MANEILDILMGKYLDGEITPEEQRLLDQSLAADESAREELNQYRRLHERLRLAVHPALEGGKPMEEIFEMAWQKASPMRRISNRFFRREWIHSAAGLAAGLLLGFVLHGMIVAPDNSVQPIPSPLAQNPTQSESFTPAGAKPPTIPGEHRNVDWYTVTDPSGEQWLLEGYRRQHVLPAMYYGDL
ncbi:MAG: hypothetical protein GX455_12165 [Phycisphaerae bacterium]|nr:hypothetical protein [Phycisphaerae bacterium]